MVSFLINQSDYPGGWICKPLCEEIEEATNEKFFPLSHGFPGKILFVWIFTLCFAS